MTNIPSTKCIIPTKTIKSTTLILKIFNLGISSILDNKVNIEDKIPSTAPE